MNVFNRSYTFTWWQVGILKLSLFALGLAAGAYWSEAVAPYVGTLVIVGVVFGLYITYTWMSRS